MPVSVRLPIVFVRSLFPAESTTIIPVTTKVSSDRTCQIQRVRRRSSNRSFPNQRQNVINRWSSHLITWRPCSSCSLWWHFPYPLGVGHGLLLHSFRYSATSWATPSLARHVVLDLLVPRLLGTSSSSGTWYCQLHHSACEVVCISSLDMSTLFLHQRKVMPSR